MDIREIESVCAVETYRNYSEAAFHISSSPAVISKHVSRVEKELGVRIFERASKSRPVELTPEGREIMDYLRTMLSCYTQAREKAAFMADSCHRSLTIGYEPFIGNFHEPEILAAFSFKNPNVTVSRKAASLTELSGMLISGVIDAALLPLMAGSSAIASSFLSDSDIVYDKVLTSSTLKLGMADSHPLAKSDIIRREQFHFLHNDTFLFSSAQQINGEQTRKHLSALLAFSEPMKFRFVDMTEPTVALKLAESGVGILPQACIVPPRIGGVSFVPVEGWDKTIVLYYVQRKSNSSPVLRAFRECVRDFSSEYGPI